MLASKFFQRLEQSREAEAKGFTRKRTAQTVKFTKSTRRHKRFAFSAKQGLDYNVDFSTCK